MKALTVQIQNVVASASFEQKFDLLTIASTFRRIEYRPDEVIRAVRKVARELRKGGITVSDKPEIQITNIVASANLGGYIDLDKLASQRMGGRILYEPEQFPALIYRWENPKVVFLVFSTGKIVCAGAKREVEIHEAVERFRRMLGEGGFLLKEEATMTSR